MRSTAGQATCLLTGRSDGGIRVDGGAATRMDLEVEVRRALCVPGVADLADLLTGAHRAPTTGVRLEVRVEVRVAVVAVQPDLVAAEAARAVRCRATDDRVYRSAVPRHHVDALVTATPRTRCAERVAER